MMLKSCICSPLCGREYGSKSLPIHYPQCTKKWLDQEALKPAHERRPLPALSTDLEAALAGEKAMPTSVRAISDFNSQMTQKFAHESLEHCNICGRSFNEKAFKKHVNLCTPYNPFKPKGTSLGAQSLSTKLAPGKISGTHHKQAVLPSQPTTEEVIKSASKPPSTALPGGSSEIPRRLPIIQSNASELTPTPTGLAPAEHGPTAANSPPLLKIQPPTAMQLPELPADVVELARSVCQEAAGDAATSALTQYLQQQRVLKRGDLKFLQLDWLIKELEPAGVSPLLLNKFLSLAKATEAP